MIPYYLNYRYLIISSYFPKVKHFLQYINSNTTPQKGVYLQSKSNKSKLSRKVNNVK